MAAANSPSCATALIARPRRDSRPSHRPSRRATDRLLRYGLPSRRAAYRPGLRPAAALHRDRCATLRLSWLSYEFVAGRLEAVAPDVSAGRVNIAHLGNKASLCAMREGRSVETTRGFIAVDGLATGHAMRGARPRRDALSDGRIWHGARELEALIYRQSRLLGVSGSSSDMRTRRAKR